MDIQFSIDGPNWITNNTRQVGANEKVISVIKQILEYRIKLLSGVIDNDKENEQKNAEEITKLKVLIERI